MKGDARSVDYRSCLYAKKRVEDWPFGLHVGVSWDIGLPTFGVQVMAIEGI